jgi:4-carboxymuconolactone decarboxylase
MRVPIPRVAFLLSAWLAGAQVPSTRDLHLVGDRFKPLTYDQMTPAQRTMTDHLLSGERGGMNGPFNVLLRSPEMGDAVQALGAQVRFHSSLPARLNEFAILITGRFWSAQYEWYAHKRLALQAGLNPRIIDALARGQRPTAMQADEEVVYNFATELLRSRQVSDPTFEAARNRLGERSLVDLIGVVGYYGLVSMVLNVDRYPLPAGIQPELKPLP